MDNRTFRMLQEADWSAIGKELVAFTIWCIRGYTWKYGGAFEIPQGHTAEDIVQHVIVKTLSGERNWDPDKGELRPWLRWQVRSVVDAFANSAAHRHEDLPLEDDSGSTDPEWLDYLSTNSQTTMADTPEEVLITEEETEQRVTVLFEVVEGDKDAEQLLDWILEAAIDGGDYKPRDIAVALDVPVKRVYNCIRRIKRRALKRIGGI